ncbi:MAG: hypothetical protein E7081_10180 [Bacteroidales bacterium]|nr:hypothetical protein [Bacteroidales bacterium]
MTMQDELTKWAKKAFEFYSQLGQKENIGFYTQTPLNDISSNPDIVVMGINPGSNGSFQKDYSIEQFMRGNFYWTQHRSWAYIKRIEDFLKRGLGNNAENIFSNDNRIVYINASCFQTKKAGALGYNLLCKSLPFTIDLIRKLNPRILLCLSAKKIFGIEQSFEREYLTEDVLIGQLENIQIIGTPHPSGRLTNAKREYIRNVINLAIKNSHLCLKECAELIRNEISLNSDQSCIQPSNEEVTEIFENITNQLISILGKPFELNDKTQRFELNNEIAITITKTGKGYIGIRHISFDNKKKYSNEEYPNIQKYTDILNQYGFNVLPKNGCWIGTKFFKRYGYDNDSTTNNILSEIKTIIDLMRE